MVIKGEWETPVDRLAAAERVLRVLAALAKGGTAAAWAAPPKPAPPPPPKPPVRRTMARRGR